MKRLLGYAGETALAVALLLVTFGIVLFLEGKLSG